LASKKTTSSPRSILRRALPHGIGLVVLVGAIAGGLVGLQRYVEKNVTYPTGPAKVVLKDRPVWMSDYLAEQIAAIAKPKGTNSAFDRQLLVDSAEALKRNPWVKQVHSVRRVYGERPGDTIEIDAEYRAPVALVQWGQYLWLVDAEGIKLPEQFNLTQDAIRKIIIGRDGHVNIRVIEGVKRPPSESGKKWVGDDLSAGLDLVKLLYGKPYAEEIISVNVSNFGGRKDAREAQLVLKTRYNTEVRWGQPVNPKDFYVEVQAAQKLARLEKIVEQYKRVDAGQQWVDIRFDQVTYPLPAAASSSNEAQATSR
jgi:hypothetical protein